MIRMDKMEREQRKRLREERREQRREQLEEFEPSPVRRINPMTGKVVEEIPVETTPRGYRTVPKSRRERAKQERKREERVIEDASHGVLARVYPSLDGRIYILNVPGQRERRFKEKAQAVAVGESMVGEGNVDVLARHPEARRSGGFFEEASKIDSIKKLADQYENEARDQKKK